MLSGTIDNLPEEIRFVSKGDLIALETAIDDADMTDGIEPESESTPNKAVIWKNY